ncbi:hypothetical protein UT300006_00070 [Clostridium sp. CTA-6]
MYVAPKAGTLVVSDIKDASVTLIIFVLNFFIKIAPFKLTYFIVIFNIKNFYNRLIIKPPL